VWWSLPHAGCFIQGLRDKRKIQTVSLTDYHAKFIAYELTRRAVNSIKISLGPIAQESNELHWKQGLSPNKGRLAQHSQPRNSKNTFLVGHKTGIRIGNINFLASLT